MANKFAKDFENNTNRDFGSFAQKTNEMSEAKKNEVQQGHEKKIEGELKNEKLSSPDFSSTKTSSNTFEAKASQTKVSSTGIAGSAVEKKSSHGDQNGETIKPAKIAKKGRKAAGAFNAVRKIAGSVASTAKGSAAAVAASVTKVGAIVGNALHVSTTVGTALVLSGTIAATTIPTAGVIGYGVSHSTQQRDGCVPEEYDEPKVNSGAQGAVDWAIKIANDDSFNYGIKPIASDTGCYFCGTNGRKVRNSGGDTRYEKTYVCMTFVTAAYAHGANDPEVLELCERGSTLHSHDGLFDQVSCFEKIGLMKDLTVDDLKPGDVFVHYDSTDGSVGGHMSMYAGEGRMVDASGGGFDPDSIALRGEGSAQEYLGYTWNHEPAQNFVMRYKGKGRSSLASNANATAISTSPSSLVDSNVWIGEAAWGNSPGDQTGREVYYHEYPGSVDGGSWSYVIRAKDDSVKVRLADAMMKACDNDHIGYNDGGTDLYYEAEKVGWDLTKITKDTSTQCSYVVDVCLRCAGVDAKYAKADTASIYIWDALEPSGQFEKLTTIPSNSELLPGDILVKKNSPGSAYLGHVAMVVKSPAADKLSPLFGGANNNDLIAEMTADDGCGGEMNGAKQSAAYIGKGMKKITAANGKEYIILDCDLEAVKKLGPQGDAQCYIYSIGYCDLIMGGKFRCSIDGDEATRHENMEKTYGESAHYVGGSHNGLLSSINGTQNNLGSTDKVLEKAISEIKAGRPVIIWTEHSMSGTHFVCVCGWTADAGSKPTWDKMVCIDPAFNGTGNDGLRTIDIYPDGSSHFLATFENWKPGSGQTKRQ